MDAEDRIEALYALRPEEFIAARDTLAAELKDHGKLASSSTVKRLRKPTVAAWALNQLTRRNAEDVAELLEVGERMRAAQEAALGGGGGDELRSATAARRDVLRRLVAAAPGGDAGELEAALSAAALDPDLGEELRVGRLSSLPATADAGFGAFEAMAAAAPEVPDSRGYDEAVRRLERAKAEEAELAAALEHAEGVAAEADAAAKKARRAVTEARRAVQKASVETARLEQEAWQAGEQLRKAEGS